MADITKDDVVEFIAQMTVLDLSEFVKELEEKFEEIEKRVAAYGMQYL